MLKLLDNPKGTSRSSVMWALVPFEAPMRYSDPRIDAALLRILRRATVPPAAKDSFAVESEAARAASALGWRECAEALPILLKLLELKGWSSSQDAFEAVAHIGAAHPPLRPAVVEFVKKRLADAPAGGRRDAVSVFDTVWRGDFRELESPLESRATASPDELEDPGSWRPLRADPPPATGRFHIARAILAAWREPDPLTRLKLNLMLKHPQAFSRDHRASCERIIRNSHRITNRRFGSSSQRLRNIRCHTIGLRIGCTQLFPSRRIEIRVQTAEGG